MPHEPLLPGGVIGPYTLRLRTVRDDGPGGSSGLLFRHRKLYSLCIILSLIVGKRLNDTSAELVRIRLNRHVNFFDR